MLAVLNGHTDCVYFMLSKGASVEARDKWGRTALHRGVSCAYIIMNSSLLYVEECPSKENLVSRVCPRVYYGFPVQKQKSQTRPTTKLILLNNNISQEADVEFLKMKYSVCIILVETIFLIE